MQIGFVGLGTMGGPMARRLAEQGHRVSGYDVDAARGARAREGGVTLAPSAAGAARIFVPACPGPISASITATADRWAA